MTVSYVIALGRIAFGAGLVVAPTMGARLYLGSEASRPSVRFMSRVFGGRDIALGLFLLDALRNDRRADAARALWLGAACDAWDATAAVRDRRLPRLGRAVVGATGATFAALGALAAVPPADPFASAAGAHAA